MEEQKEEQVEVAEMGGSQILEATVSKKRDTSFVDERKKQIELYGNYYPAGLSGEGIIEWANLEIVANEGLNENLRLLKNTTESKIESDRQAKLAATLAGLSEAEREQLKTMLG